MRQLVTERDILRLARRSQLQVSKDAIVTAAAREAAQMRQVDLICSDEPAPPRQPASRELPDGDYLVTIRNGQIVASRRLAD